MSCQKSFEALTQARAGSRLDQAVRHQSAQGLSLRYKRPKRNKAAQLRRPKTLAGQINQMWSMDFVADNLFDERKLRMLTVVDCCSRESLALHVGQSLKGEDVASVLSQIVVELDFPRNG